MQTTKRRVERLGYLAGALFPVAIWASITMSEAGRPYPDYEQGAVTTQALRQYFDASTVNAFGTTFGIIALALVVWFAGALYVRSSRISEAARPAAMFALIGAAVYAALFSGQAGSFFVTQYNIATVDPAVLLTWWASADLTQGLFVGAFLGIAGLLASIAYLGFVHHVVPKWTAWPAAVVATTMAFGTIAAPFGDIGFIAWLSFMAFTLWMFVVGIRLAVRPGDAIEARTPRRSRRNVPEVPVAA